jgi:hypothetical protein
MNGSFQFNAPGVLIEDFSDKSLKFQFTLENFHQYSQQLRVIIMSRQNYDPMTQFKNLEPKQQRLFNEELNRYIRALTGDFHNKITEDFNYICNEEIFPFLNTKYKNMAVRPSNEEELSNETKEYTELIFRNSMLDNELTETQLKKIPIIDNP